MHGRLRASCGSARGGPGPGAAAAASRRGLAALEEVKYNDVKVTEIQRKILDSNARLKQQQNLYEQVRSERNLYSKQLLEAKDLAAWKRVFQLRVERRKRWYATIEQAKLAADGDVVPSGAAPVTKRDSYSHGSRRMSALSASDAPAGERCPERGVTEL